VIHTIHTLGPADTNCEKAAKSWIKKHNHHANIILYPTLEEAIKNVSHNSVLLSCIVYPKLNDLVFDHIDRFELIDCFIEPLYNMVFARKSLGAEIKIIYSHPAPVPLLKRIPSVSLETVQLVNSNAEAALLCKQDDEACITTQKSADKHQLIIQNDFGSLPMGFAIHAPIY
jgi:prephenate dehydratase